MLYVEDNEVNRTLVEQLFALRRPGVALLTAGSDELKARLLPKCATGEWSPAFALCR